MEVYRRLARSRSQSCCRVSSSAEGFKITQAQFTLTSGENRDVSFALTIGSDTTSITVTSQAALLDTGDSREELTLNHAALDNLPLVTRNPISLLGLTPGVTGIQAPTTTFNPETTNHYSSSGKGAMQIHSSSMGWILTATSEKGSTI
jgi:hypothetical protein